MKISEAAANAQSELKQSKTQCDYISFRDAIRTLETARLDPKDFKKQDHKSNETPLWNYTEDSVKTVLNAEEKGNSLTKD